MSEQELFEKMKEAVMDLDDDLLAELVDEALAAGRKPLDLITLGLSPGLEAIGDGFNEGTRFMSDLVLAGEMMTDTVGKLQPFMESGDGNDTGQVMVIGTVEGDVHFIGKRIVAAVFAGEGFRVIDIGENASAQAFAEAAKKHNATVVGCSAILSPCKPYVGVVHHALVDAGVRDNLLLIAGGWAFTEEQALELGADAVGEDAMSAVRKVMKLQSARAAHA